MPQAPIRLFAAQLRCHPRAQHAPSDGQRHGDIRLQPQHAPEQKEARFLNAQRARPSGITAMKVPTPSGFPTRRTVISLVTPKVPSLPTNSAVRS